MTKKTAGFWFLSAVAGATLAACASDPAMRASVPDRPARSATQTIQLGNPDRIVVYLFRHRMFLTPVRVDEAYLEGQACRITLTTRASIDELSEAVSRGPYSERPPGPIDLRYLVQFYADGRLTASIGASHEMIGGVVLMVSAQRPLFAAKSLIDVIRASAISVGNTWSSRCSPLEP